MARPSAAAYSGAMITRAVVLSLALLLAPSRVSAQLPSPPPPVPTAPPADAPDFGLSIGLHATAVVSASLGTFALAVGSLGLAGCSFGGCTNEAGVWASMTIAGAVLTTAAIAFGMSATMVHSHTRARRAALGLAELVPSLWIEPRGGGAALAARF